MPRLELHPLPGAKRAAELVRLVERLYRDRRRVVVWVGDRGRLQILDDYLWTYEKLAFVPHGVGVEGEGMDDPVALVSDAMNPNGAEVLVVGDGLPPGEWAAGFHEVHDLVPGGEAGNERREFWQRWKETTAGEGRDG
jgi:DNA polymerase IIIc chi subunit